MRRLFPLILIIASLTRPGMAQAAQFPNATCPDSVTIRQILDPDHPCRPATRDTVRGVAGIVVGFDSQLPTYTLYVQSPEGGAYSGIAMTTTPHNTLASPFGFALGDSIVIEYARISGTRLFAPNSSTSTPDFILRKVSSGNALPPLFEVEPSQIRWRTQALPAERHVSCLTQLLGPLKVVRIRDPYDVATDIEPNCFVVIGEGSPNDSVYVDGRLLTTLPAPALGTIIHSITGILGRTTSGLRIYLRNSEDITPSRLPNLELATPENWPHSPVAVNRRILSWGLPAPTPQLDGDTLNTYVHGAFGLRSTVDTITWRAHAYIDAIPVAPLIDTLYTPDTTSTSTQCYLIQEGSSVNIQAPPGMVFVGAEASYGTPSGSDNCANGYAIGTCHAANSTSVVAGWVMGRTTATLRASNDFFGDPCFGTLKRLYARVFCGPITSPSAFSTAPPEMSVFATSIDSLTLHLRVTPYPIAVRGGWHTVTSRADPEDLLDESFENDNDQSMQLLWRPRMISSRSSGIRPAPPLRGSGARPNCDAVAIRRDSPFPWLFSAVSTANGDDYDLTLYDDYVNELNGLNHAIGTSHTRGGGIEFVAGRPMPNQLLAFPAITRFAASDSSTYSYDFTDALNRTSRDSLAAWQSQTLPLARLADIYAVFAYAGCPLNVRLTTEMGHPDLAFEILDSSTGLALGRGSSLGRGASVSTASNVDTLLYSGEHGWHYIVVYRATASDLRPATYTLAAEKQAPLAVPGTSPSLETAIGLPSPHPIEGRTRIHLTLSSAGHYRLECFDLAGRRVADLHDGALEAGAHAFELEPRGQQARLAPGLYILRLQGAGIERTRRVVVR